MEKLNLPTALWNVILSKIKNISKKFDEVKIIVFLRIYINAYRQLS